MRDVTIVIPTRNRPDMLRDMLGSLRRAERTDLGIEILVVDNNSSAALAPQVAEVVRASPLGIRLLTETQPGQSAALNCGIRAAKGDIIAFLDDDITVHKSYFVGLAETLHCFSATVFGGRVFAAWPKPQPAWINQGRPLTTSFGPIVAHDYGDEPRVYADDMRLPVGCNFFCRHALFQRYGVFDTHLGPGAGPGILGGGETDLLRRFRAGGETLLYAPLVAVDHPVTLERMTKRYFRYRFFCSGRSIPYLQRQGPQRSFGVPRYLLRMLGARAGRALIASVRGDTTAALEHQFAVCEILGAIYEYRRLAGRRSP